MKKLKALLLSAGLGTRLRPLTDEWPKCLMPIGARPLLEYWLCALVRSGVSEVLVNTHHHHKLVESFLKRQQFSSWVQGFYESNLLGTAGTLRENFDFFEHQTALVIHSDNWCQCDFSEFLEFHRCDRPAGTLITMMVFYTDYPRLCGIVELNQDRVVVQLHEKVSNPPSNLANGAVYIVEPEVLSWINERPTVMDFSTQVLPEFFGKIAVWENKGIHRDIGIVQSLMDAQRDPKPELCWIEEDEWLDSYRNNPIHERLKALST